MNQDTIAVVTNIPRPYRRALFAVLRNKLASQGLGLKVLYTSDPGKHVRRTVAGGTISDPEMEQNVRSLAIRLSYERVVSVPIRLRATLKQLNPCCVVAGGFGPDALITESWCRSARVPYVLWSGGWGPEAGQLRSMNRARLVRRAEASVAYGSAAADYLVSLGAQPDRLFYAWNTVDLEGIASAAKAASASRAELTPKYQLAAKNLLFVGSLVERKGVRELVAAALKTESSDSDWALHLVGPGPLRDELEQSIRAAEAETRFRFHGSRPPQDVAELLGVADGLLLPTKREPWGLVINEAMACGVPVVASPWAGAARDLIQDGVTGYVIEPADTTALSRSMGLLLSGSPSVEAVGRAGAHAVRARASLQESAEGFVSAIKCALAK